MRVLVTGATGYVGSRLVPALLDAGHEVVAAARNPAKLAAFPWIDRVDTVELDVLDEGSCVAALAGGDLDVAYYLVHAIGEGDFAARDRDAAGFFSAAAAEGGVGRIVYLGGFVPDGETLSDHLDSRAETAEVLERSGVPVVWLRAAVIVGAGSTSFEIIRYLADRLPVLPTPEWMGRLVQPIAVDDVLHYLVAAAADLPAGGYDIAGEEVLPYRDLLRAYLDAAGLRRRLVPVPGVAPGMAAAVIGRLTPVPSALTADLIDSLRNTMVSGDDRIRQLVPDPPGGLTPLADSMRRALAAGGAPGAVGDGDPLSLAATDPEWAGGDASSVRAARPVDAPAATVWERIEGIAGPRWGFLGWPVAWRTRGVGLRLATGSGLTADRVTPGRWSVDDRIDFFRVDEVDDGRRLRFVTAPHAPGKGVVELRVEPDGADRCTLHVDATWLPRGSAGRAWWWGLRPLHAGAFAGLARTLARDAEAAGSARE